MGGGGNVFAVAVVLQVYCIAWVSLSGKKKGNLRSIVCKQLLGVVQITSVHTIEQPNC